MKEDNYVKYIFRKKYICVYMYLYMGMYLQKITQIKKKSLTWNEDILLHSDLKITMPDFDLEDE